MLPIEGHPDYFISDGGMVYSTKSGTMKSLKPQRDQDGYLHVVLSTDGVPHTIKIQRLVALHFIGPKPDRMVVCHINGDKDNNASGNLRYDTQAGNIADIKLHGHENPPRGSMNGQARLTEPDVVELRRLRDEFGLSQAELGRRFGISREQARDIVNRKAWAHV